jgi:uncharacterized membrane protein YdfJ with MMPL/SSD domain
LLIDFTKSLIVEGIEKKRAIAMATATRAKPIMLTALAIILGSLLLATDPIFGGLGIALIFGSMVATLVSLFFIPILMDNARAMMPLASPTTEVKIKNTIYKLKEQKQLKRHWCVLTYNVHDYFITYRDKWNER